MTLFQSFELLRDWTIQLGYNSRVTGEIGKGCCSSESSVVIIGISAMSMSSSSASSSGGGSGHPRQAMGARPKIIAQQQKEEQTGQEWNSNWNPTLSAQVSLTVLCIFLLCTCFLIQTILFASTL